MNRNIPNNLERRQINFDDDLVIVYDENGLVMYKGIQDFEPMKDDDWKWDNSIRAYRLDSYIKICLDI